MTLAFTNHAMADRVRALNPGLVVDEPAVEAAPPADTTN